jgi:hypothetical protein
MLQTEQYFITVLHELGLEGGAGQHAPFLQQTRESSTPFLWNFLEKLWAASVARIFSNW